jgi:hypothetical protein
MMGGDGRAVARLDGLAKNAMVCVASLASTHEARNSNRGAASQDMHK